MADKYNCTPYWELSTAQQDNINGDLTSASLTDGDIRGCHAECRKCGQKRLVSNPLGARWCRRCQEVFTLEYINVGVPISIVNFAAPVEPPITKQFMNEQMSPKRHISIGKVFVVALIAATIGCLCAVCKVRFKLGWMP